MTAMTPEFLVTIAHALFVGVYYGYHTIRQQKREAGQVAVEERRPRFRRGDDGFGFLGLIGFAIFYYMIQLGTGVTYQEMLTGTFSLYVHLSLFYGLLLLGLPLLRGRITARSCGELWLLPAMLSWLLYRSGSLIEPLFVIRLPLELLRIAAVIWLLGTIFVFWGYVLAHLSFRQQVLDEAVPVDEAWILRLWEEQKEICNLKESIPLVISDQVDTPLSIGVFASAIRVVLPKRQYTRDELELIFCHELIHISRDDGANKLYLALCSALCWFNPIMWTAMKRSAEDLELSCDETVLLGADAATRKRYAALLLQTAGDPRGFTTCLSAGAKALRYRLRHVVKERKLRSGALVIGVLLFVFTMTCGIVSVGYNAGTMEELIFQGEAENYTLRTIYYKGKGGDHGEISLYDSEGTHLSSVEEALREALAELECIGIRGEFVQFDTREMRLHFEESGGGAVIVTLKNRILTVFSVHDRDRTTYVLERRPDWDYLESLLMVR